MSDNVVKIVVIGDIGVGKSSIIRRYVDNDYTPEYKISVQLDFKQKQVLQGEKKINIQMWDIPGHERFGGMTNVYYKYSHGALVVFDLSRRETFLSGLAWLSDYIHSMELDEDNVMPVMLVGNKNDVDSVHVSRKEYDTWVEDNHVLGFYDVSARNNTNIDEAVNCLLSHILNSNSNNS